ncbi:hypothetical protein CDL12_11629 [Handroanthus impetiginosus]|uniref:Uncharacterized protein n=1 Tax=Handroanthus impetiginosus TaxID=429701 RepID=A0A2G9HE50_9LAMI|nr:hypothetical protein CDL12_11629 [Handroanthus impetiginosus]
MGRSGSSSKRKSSKKKRDKVSFQKKTGGRTESKRHRRIYDSDDDSVNSEHTSSSTSRSDHRRRANKNKKLRRDYLVSSYSDDSDSDSMSSYDSGYKRKKSRRSQVSLKSKKKRAQKRSASPESNSDAHNVRKRKRSDRDRAVKRKKKSSKKKPRKHLSSPSSSDSESCSTCQSRSSSSTSDGKHRRNKAILDNKIERFRGRESYKARKKRKERSPSCSSSHRASDHGLSIDHSIRALSAVNNSRRLKSVIAVVHQPHDEGENRYEKDLHKEEIVYDQDDYPSPKSMDSNEGSKMELDYNSHRASNKSVCVENIEGEEVTELGKSGINEGDKKTGGDHQSEGADMNNFEGEKEIDVPVPAADDLESILRQRALENLRKFRGGLQSGPSSTNLEKNNGSDVHRLSTRQVDDVQSKSTNEGSFSDQEMNQRSGNSSKRDSSLLKVVKQLPVNDTVAHSPDGAAVLGCSEEGKGASSHAVSANAVSRSDTSPGVRATNACSSTAEPASSVGLISGEHSSEQQNEAKDGSQFEQKTMSVMRGGEMVQVSYKVYIPKKAPALTRRQLKR